MQATINIPPSFRETAASPRDLAKKLVYGGNGMLGLRSFAGSNSTDKY